MDKGIVMTKQNVLALLAKRKFRTMRVIKPQPYLDTNTNEWVYRYKTKKHNVEQFANATEALKDLAPYQVGDRLYVKEGYQIKSLQVNPDYGFVGNYLADGKEFLCRLTTKESNKWVNRTFPHRPTSGRFMYKSLARIFMTITKITVQRPRDLEPEDIIAEGLRASSSMDLIACWSDLWNSLHKDGWKKNEWCFVYHWEEIEEKE